MKTSARTLIHFITLCALLSATGSSFGQAREEQIMPNGDGSVTMNRSAMGFEENKGQVRAIDGQPAPYVKFRLTQGDVTIFLLERGIAYQFQRSRWPTGYAELAMQAGQDPDVDSKLRALREQVIRETYRMDMVLEGADPNARITMEGRSADYTNYYTHDALDVRTYSKVVYHEVYPGIDWVVRTGTTGMEYDFVVRPGADPGAIRLHYTDQEELRVDEQGDLVQGNRLGHLTERHPVSYQGDKAVLTEFALTGSTVRFSVGSYDHNQSLTIDPYVVWATYYGGSADDYGWSCASDQEGNAFLAGDTQSPLGIANNGHQTTIGSTDFDAYLVKFDADGARLWATYYGGSFYDEGRDCVADGDGNVYLAGSTRSTDGMAYLGHQNTLAGESDCFLVKFNPAGVRQWGTYYGGEGDDYGRSCTVDENNNAYVVGYTYSSTGIAFNGHQDTLGGLYDAFVSKFAPDGTQIWGTYYGGAEADIAGGVCVVVGTGEIYVGGGTQSPSMIAAGGFLNNIAGGSDAFLVKFQSNGTRLWGTYYGGPSVESGGRSVAADGQGNVYLAGGTNSDSGIAYSGFQNSRAGLGDCFLVKFNGAGERQWGSYYGGAGSELNYAVAANSSGEVYLAGVTDSNIGIAMDGPQTEIGGGIDAFLVKFDPSGDREWSTYHGGQASDSFAGCRLDGAGNAYACGATGSVSAIAFGGFQNQIASSADAFLVKFNSGFVGIDDTSAFGPCRSFSIWSNPIDADGDLLVSIQLKDFTRVSPVQALVHDLTGNLVQQGAVAALDGSGMGLLHLDRSLASGVYTLTLMSENFSSTQRLVIR